MTDSNKQLDRLLIEQSAGLLEAMKHGGENERRGLVDWLLQSKRHVRTHLFMTAMEEELRHVDPQRRIPIPVVHAVKISALKSTLAGRVATQSARRWTWAAAAGIVLALAATLLFRIAFDDIGRWHEYRTATGEQRAVQLEDGSIVQLNTASRVEARLSASSRDIRLLAGEALFKVRQDPARPFNVYTEDATIVAVGTQFNVYRLAGRTKVSVLEGRVRVSARDGSLQSPATPVATAPLITAGEEVEIRGDGRIDRRRAPDVANTAAWIQRRVVFKQEPLEKVVSEFNRYRKTPQFRVADPVLAMRKYSGTFDIDDPDSLEAVLANERDITIESSGDAVVIRRRSAQGSP